jgi:hypothetical protein
VPLRSAGATATGSAAGLLASAADGGAAFGDNAVATGAHATPRETNAAATRAIQLPSATG